MASTSILFEPYVDPLMNNTLKHVNSANDIANNWIGVAERDWVSLFNGRNPHVTLTILGFVMHEVVYFGRYMRNTGQF